jgi:Bacterial CdiA-CT RNAse A domain
MPPQQPERPLDLLDAGLNFRPHSLYSVARPRAGHDGLLTKDVATAAHAGNLFLASCGFRGRIHHGSVTMSRSTFAAILILLAAACMAVAPAAADQCLPVGGFPANWLQVEEAAGGHTIARHVGLSDAALVARLRKEPRIAAASTFTDLAVAEAAITRAFAATAVRINRWAASAAPGATRVDNFGPAAAAVGRRADRPPSLAHIINRRTFRTVIRASGAGGCFLLTSYPT